MTFSAIRQRIARQDCLTTVLASYVLLVTTVVIVTNLLPLLRYGWTYSWGLVLTDLGVGIILPLTPMTRTLLGLTGAVGSLLALGGRRVGVIIILLWAAAQIPSFTLLFGRVTALDALVDAPLNLQLFFVGYGRASAVKALSTLSGRSAYYVTGLGVNVVGIILSVIALWILTRGRLAHSTLARRFPIQATLATRRIANNVFAATLIVGLLLLVAEKIFDAWQHRPQLTLEVTAVTPLRCMLLGTAARPHLFGAVDLALRAVNRGDKTTTVERVELLLHGGDEAAETFGALRPYYPAGLRPQPWRDLHDPWDDVRDTFAIKRLPAIRLEPHAVVDATVSFLLPFAELGRSPGWQSSEPTESAATLRLWGHAAMETIDGHRTTSAPIMKDLPCFLFPRQ